MNIGKHLELNHTKTYVIAKLQTLNNTVKYEKYSTESKIKGTGNSWVQKPMQIQQSPLRVLPVSFTLHHWLLRNILLSFLFISINLSALYLAKHFR